MDQNRRTRAQDAAIETARIHAQRLRRHLAEMKEMTGTDGEPLFSSHMLRMAEDSVDASERYAMAARSRQKA